MIMQSKNLLRENPKQKYRITTHKKGLAFLSSNNN